jgi:hypothetical protein
MAAGSGCGNPPQRDVGKLYLSRSGPYGNLPQIIDLIEYFSLLRRWHELCFMLAAGVVNLTFQKEQANDQET